MYLLQIMGQKNGYTVNLIEDLVSGLFDFGVEELTSSLGSPLDEVVMEL